MRGDGRIWWVSMAAALAAGLAFRLWHVFAEPLWLDEAYSAFAADHDFTFLWQVVPRYETHPPFYYTLLHAWVGLAGDGVAALRLPGLVAGLATLPIVAAGAMEAGALLGWDAARRRRLAGVATALAALSVQLVLMSRQVRPYPLLILAYAVAIWLLLRLRARVGSGRPIAGPLLAGYLLALELLLWLHNMGPLFAAAASLALAVAIVGRRLSARDWAWLAAGHLVVALAYLPGLRILSAQAPTWIATTWLRLRAGDVLGHLQMLYAAPDAAALAAIGLAAAAAAMGWRRRGGRGVAMLFVLALLPVASSLLLSMTVAPVFITRTMAPVAVPAVLLFAIGATAWEGWRATLALAAAGVLALGCAAADLVDARAGPMQDWYALVDWLGPRLRPGDAVLAYPNEGALPLGYALRDRGVRVPVLPIPAPVPAFAEPGAWYPSGSRGVVALGDARLRAIAAAPRLRAVPTIWLLRLSRQLYDPRDAGLRAFAAGRRRGAGFRAGDLELRGLSRAQELLGKRP